MAPLMCDGTLSPVLALMNRTWNATLLCAFAAVLHRRHHIKVCLVAGVGFFTDAYDIFAISIAATMLGYVYGSGAFRSWSLVRPFGLAALTGADDASMGGGQTAA